MKNYIPEAAIPLVQELLNEHPILIKVVRNRRTKHGDFKKKIDGRVEITINNNLNQYQFLLTLIHEIAHFVTFKKHPRVKPHGIEWKVNFQHLMLPFLKPEIFPLELLPPLANYLKNPKAATDSDVKLTYALNTYSDNSGKNFIFELSDGDAFLYKNSKFIRGKKRRTRYECLNLNNNKIYTFNANTEIELISNVAN